MPIDMCTQTAWANAGNKTTHCVLSRHVQFHLVDVMDFIARQSATKLALFSLVMVFSFARLPLLLCTVVPDCSGVIMGDSNCVSC